MCDQFLAPDINIVLDQAQLYYRYVTIFQEGFFCWGGGCNRAKQNIKANNSYLEPQSKRPTGAALQTWEKSSCANASHWPSTVTTTSKKNRREQGSRQRGKGGGMKDWMKEGERDGEVEWSIRGPEKEENNERTQSESCQCIINKHSPLIVVSTCAQTHTEAHTNQRGGVWASAGSDYKHVMINAVGLRLWYPPPLSCPFCCEHPQTVHAGRSTQKHTDGTKCQHKHTHTHEITEDNAPSFAWAEGLMKQYRLKLEHQTVTHMWSTSPVLPRWLLFWFCFLFFGRQSPLWAKEPGHAGYYPQGKTAIQKLSKWIEAPQWRARRQPGSSSSSGHWFTIPYLSDSIKDITDELHREAACRRWEILTAEALNRSLNLRRAFSHKNNM